jgi:hypothetical protein
MNFQLSDFKKYKEYFEKVATESKHVDGFLFGDVDIGQEEAGSWQGKKLWAWPADRSKLQDQHSDNFFLGREGSIWVGGPCNSELHSDQDEFYNQCEVIMKKVISRLIKDKIECSIDINLTGSVKRADTKLSSTAFIGCEYTFTITDPDGFAYSEDDWEAEP